MKQIFIDISALGGMGVSQPLFFADKGQERGGGQPDTDQYKHSQSSCVCAVCRFVCRKRSRSRHCTIVVYYRSDWGALTKYSHADLTGEVCFSITYFPSKRDQKCTKVKRTRKLIRKLQMMTYQLTFSQSLSQENAISASSSQIHQKLFTTIS